MQDFCCVEVCVAFAVFEDAFEGGDVVLKGDVGHEHHFLLEIRVCRFESRNGALVIE